MCLEGWCRGGAHQWWPSGTTWADHSVDAALALPHLIAKGGYSCLEIPPTYSCPFRNEFYVWLIWPCINCPHTMQLGLSGRAGPIHQRGPITNPDQIKSDRGRGIGSCASHQKAIKCLSLHFKSGIYKLIVVFDYLVSSFSEWMKKLLLYMIIIWIIIILMCTFLSYQNIISLRNILQCFLSVTVLTLVKSKKNNYPLHFYSHHHISAKSIFQIHLPHPPPSPSSCYVTMVIVSREMASVALH